ncbi:TrbI/VirB10 family protein [Acidithiobacillus thiooxidans]|uniref:TrbI/VirB10 family protein n=1 Tax=Acidithiobacillus thiooxidans TaxID=930 RepID=UPI00285F7932|nr:TrbI/VirB10 family protein [Acidithiobacillus thiooxidans]MDR7925777.1 TrbI/VirB10 family protein [Acidithiobacillus thiooxidans]
MAENDKPTVPDITGGGAGGKSAPLIRPAPAHGGKRLSQKGKAIVLVGGGSLVALTVVGIMQASHHPSSGSSAGSAPPQIGISQPPSPPPPMTLARNGNASGDLQQNGATASTASGHSAQLGPASLHKKLTPAEKYQEWLVNYHYNMLEARVQDQTTAKSSKLTTGSGTGETLGTSLGTATGNFNVNPDSYLQAALKAISQTGTVPPDLLKKIQGFEGAGGQGGRGSGQNDNQQFLSQQKSAKDKNGYLDESLQKPLNRNEVTAGSIIPAVMVTDINSDLPGEIVAQVRQNVYDSLDPDRILIPQGTKIIGEYSSAVAYGQSRVLVAWNRLIYPNGETIALQGMPGTNGIGEAGFHDLVDNHYLRIFGSAILISLIGAGAQLSQPQQSSAFQNPTPGQTAAAAMAQEMDSVGTNLLNKNLNIQPTLRIRPGYLFNVLVTRTMILPPYPAEQP